MKAAERKRSQRARRGLDSWASPRPWDPPRGSRSRGSRARGRRNSRRRPVTPFPGLAAWWSVPACGWARTWYPTPANGIRGRFHHMHNIVEHVASFDGAPVTVRACWLLLRPSRSGKERRAEDTLLPLAPGSELCQCLSRAVNGTGGKPELMSETKQNRWCHS